MGGEGVSAGSGAALVARDDVAKVVLRHATLRGTARVA